MTVALSWLGGTVLGAIVGGRLGWQSDKGSDMPGFSTIIYGGMGAIIGGAVGVVGGAIFL